MIRVLPKRAIQQKPPSEPVVLHRSLWVLAGSLDYICHRRTKIETTSGPTESIIHTLMMTEAGIPMLLGLYLEVNAGVILLMIAAFFAHAGTAIWDVAYVVERRKVTPNEQHVHSFLEVLPFCAVSFVIVHALEPIHFTVWGRWREAALRIEEERAPSAYSLPRRFSGSRGHQWSRL
jgi:hypothetical protein